MLSFTKFLTGKETTCKDVISGYIDFTTGYIFERMETSFIKSIE
jgi:hypothetical protein